MNDYFSKLAARARAAEPEIRPNLDSSFTPPTDNQVGLAGLAVVETEQVAPEPTSSPVPLSKYHRLAPETGDAIAPKAGPSARPEMNVGESRTAATPPETATEEAFPAAKATPPTPSGPSTRRPAANAAPPTPTPTPDALPLAATTHVENASFPLRSSVTHESDEEAAAPTMILPAATAQNAGSVAPMALRSRRGTPIPNSSGRPAVTSVSGASERSSEESPTVHVTIGRLEIRALPTTPPAPASRAQPRLSLDEYLKRGSGGVR